MTGIEETMDVPTEIKNIFQYIVTEKSTHIRNKIDIHMQDEHRTPNRQDQNRNSPKHIIIKMPNVGNKDRILNAAREKHQVSLRGRPIRFTSDFSTQEPRIKERLK